MKTIDLEPPVSLHDNVYLGCKQEPEKINLDSVLQKSLIFNGFFMEQHLQDVADADRSSTSSSAIAPRKRMLNEKEKANPKTLLKEEYCLTADGSLGSDTITKENSSDITGCDYPMCGHVEQCVSKWVELANKKAS